MPTPDEPLRYRVLLHTRSGAAVHYDLLLSIPEQEALLAWRLHEWPLPKTIVQEATRLPDHRRVYLTYEGPLSGNRGEVHQVDSGTVQYRERSAFCFQFNLQSDHGDLRHLKLWVETHQPAESPEWLLIWE